MAPFLVTHPCLLNSWIMAREVAFARGLHYQNATPEQLERAATLLHRARLHCLEWQVEDAIQMQRIHVLRDELDRLCTDISDHLLDQIAPFADLYRRAADGSARAARIAGIPDYRAGSRRGGYVGRMYGNRCPAAPGT